MLNAREIPIADHPEGGPARRALAPLLAEPSDRADFRIKVEALMACVRTADRSVVPVVRALIHSERHPFVLATMASLLGRLGGPDDGGPLVELLDEPDGRVVANALEALDRLGVPFPLGRVTQLISSPIARVRTHAMALLAKSEPERVLALLPGYLTSPQPEVRGGVAYLLGEMCESNAALDVLLSQMAREREGTVLRQLAASLRKHASPLTGRILIGRLFKLRTKREDEASMLLGELLRDIGVELGWVESDVHRIGQAYLDAHRTGATLIAMPDPTAVAIVVNVEELGDADLPASFSAVWGQNGSGAARRPARLPRPLSLQPAPPPRTLAGPLGVALLMLVAGHHLLPQRPDVAAAEIAPSPAKVAPGVSTGRALAGSAPPAVAPVIRAPAGSGGGSGGGGGNTSPGDRPEGSDLSDLPGGVGSRLDVEGEVVSASVGQVVLQAGTRYFLLRGRGLDRFQIGHRERVRGVVVGASDSGIVYLELVDV